MGKSDDNHLELGHSSPSKISPEMPSQVMVHVRTDLDVIPLRLASSETGRVDLPNFAKAWFKAEAKSHFLLDFIL